MAEKFQATSAPAWRSICNRLALRLSVKSSTDQSHLKPHRFGRRCPPTPTNHFISSVGCLSLSATEPAVETNADDSNLLQNFQHANSSTGAADEAKMVAKNP
jgi:hypothetical protein